MNDGALLFGRYAFPPNRLGYCGPDSAQELFEYVSSERADRGLVELERRFEGAYPYLCLIARANGIADPFDRGVVEAYWIGNEYLQRVDAASFHDSLDERFRPRIQGCDFAWLTSKLGLGAKPHHNFHVFEVYLRTGLMNDTHATIVVETMDACRISWGRVISVDGAELVVARRPLRLIAGKLALADEEIVRITRQIEGRGFADHASSGANVSIHWNWVCEQLSSGRLQRLMSETQRYLQLANETL
ncbi:MAG TPA: DUF6390 family protein [Ktedonobacterales bacterium]|jgi:hypothetical protein